MGGDVGVLHTELRCDPFWACPSLGPMPTGMTKALREACEGRQGLATIWGLQGAEVVSIRVSRFSRVRLCATP